MEYISVPVNPPDEMLDAWLGDNPMVPSAREEWRRHARAEWARWLKAADAVNEPVVVISTEAAPNIWNTSLAPR